MRLRGGSNAIGDLCNHWQRWTRIVELFAKRKRGYRRFDPAWYTDVHDELLETCRSLAEMVDAEERVYFQDLEHLVVPWVSPKSFEVADRQILDDLLHHCHEIERELGGRKWS